MRLELEAEVRTAFERVRARDIDRDFLPQGRLDVVSRNRVSAFPWRGQFTPGLVAVLLDSYGRPGGTVLDPFVGSGTTLAEANRHGMDAIGTEVNPAAVELARVFTLAGKSVAIRKAALEECQQQLASCLLQGTSSLFGDSSTSLIDDVLCAYKQCSSAESANLVAVTLMLAMGDSAQLDSHRLRRAFGQVGQVVEDLADEITPSRVYAADARRLPLLSRSVDFIVTSPPYINVFNYHQNYRQAIERLGWQVLPSARTEIGSNRKHRQNRFLTVTQYAIDMMLALEEFCRVCRPGARIAIIIGRESKVRRISFANGEIIACLADLMPMMNRIRWHERCFVNRFGEKIYEEILVFEVTDSEVISSGKPHAAEVGRQMLLRGLDQSATAEVAAEMEDAIRQSPKILPSPELALLRADMALAE
jgi:DNA modification methylase